MIQDLHRVVELVEGGWRDTRILVVGDIMLDRYIWEMWTGYLRKPPSRLCVPSIVPISPEARQTSP